MRNINDIYLKLVKSSDEKKYISNLLENSKLFFPKEKEILVIDFNEEIYPTFFKKNNYKYLTIETNKVNFQDILEKYNKELLKKEKEYDYIFLPFIIEKFRNINQFIELIINIRNSLKLSGELLVYNYNQNSYEVVTKLIWDNVYHQRLYHPFILKNIFLLIDFQVENSLSRNEIINLFKCKKTHPIDIKPEKVTHIIYKLESIYGKVINSNKNYYEKFLEFFTEKDNILQINCREGQMISLLQEKSIKHLGISENYFDVYISRKKNLSVISANYLEFIQNKLEDYNFIFIDNYLENLENEPLINFIYKLVNNMKKNDQLIISFLNFTNTFILKNCTYFSPNIKRPIHIQTITEILKILGMQVPKMNFVKESMYLLAKKVSEIPIEIKRLNKEELIFKIKSIFFQKYLEVIKFNYEKQKNYFKYFDLCERVLVFPFGNGNFLDILNNYGIYSESISETEIIKSDSYEKKYKIHHQNYLDFLEKNSKLYDGIFCYYYINTLDEFELIKFLKLCFKNLEKTGVLVLLFANFENSDVNQMLYYANLFNKKPTTTTIIIKVATEIGFKIIKKGSSEDKKENYICLKK